MNSETKQCQNCKQNFVIEPDDFAFYERMAVPPPTFCPDCRLQRRIAWRNERTLYKRQCELCKEDTLSMFFGNMPVSGFCQKCWWSDSWNPMSYGRGYNFSRNFFEQLATLLKEVPLQVLQSRNAVNSPYANYLSDSKNVYMSFSTTNGSENVFYSKDTDKSSFIVDSFGTSNSENCYNNINGDKNYNSMFLLNSRNCIDSAFLYDCVECQSCVMSTNLRNKSFCIRNKQYNKEEFSKELKRMDLGSYQGLLKNVEEYGKMKQDAISKYASVVNCTGSTGNDLRNSRNAKHAFGGYDFENVKYVFRSYGVKDSVDVTNLARSELVYEFMAAGGDGSQSIGFIVGGLSALNSVYYSLYSMSSSHLFGCASLRNKQYCILNKQYTKEEYESLVPRIIKHMNDMPYVDKKGRIYRYGEFFPPELSPFAYNETIAQEYFPLTKEEAEKQGYHWKDPDTKEYQITIKPEALPNHIKDVKDDIFAHTIGCAHQGACTHQCTTAFRIIPEELSFYRRMNLPLPRLCPNCRHYERLAQRNPLKLWHRGCMCSGTKSDNNIYQNTSKHQHGAGKCTNEFETSYAPERKEIVYCEQCYNAEVV